MEIYSTRKRKQIIVSSKKFFQNEIPFGMSKIFCRNFDMLK